MQDKQRIIRDYHGEDTEIDKAVEELGELIVAIIKYKHNKTPENLANVKEEIADVGNGIGHVIDFWKIELEEIETIAEEKNDREVERIEGGIYER